MKDERPVTTGLLPKHEENSSTRQTKVVAELTQRSSKTGRSKTPHLTLPA